MIKLEDLARSLFGTELFPLPRAERTPVNWSTAKPIIEKAWSDEAATILTHKRALKAAQMRRYRAKKAEE